MATERTVTRIATDRPYCYAIGPDRIVYAYKRDEWGIGRAQPFGNYSANTVIGLYVVTILMTVPAILAPLFLILAVVSPNIGAGLFALVCTLLFTGGWLLGISTLRQEHRAAKRRRLRGLPKPGVVATDDRARKWFEEHPGSVEITRENFPFSVYRFPGEQPAAGADRGL